MLVTPVVNNAPSPANSQFTSNGGPLLVQFAGSAFSGTPNQKITVDLIMDSSTVIASASVYTNEANSHKALVPVAVLISATPGLHTFKVRPTNASIDVNDFFTITVTEFQHG